MPDAVSLIQREAGAEVMLACLEAGGREAQALLAAAIINSQSLFLLAQGGFGSRVVARLLEVSLCRLFFPFSPRLHRLPSAPKRTPTPCKRFRPHMYPLITPVRLA
jgi:hypothetical protein